jgi:lysozyme family protein
MAEFMPAFTATLVHEGFPGYAIDNNGAQVVAGINRGFWPGWTGWPLIDFLTANGLGRAEVNAQLKKDTKLISEVQDFYLRNFWPVMFNDIHDQGVANWLFDHGVNMGIKQAVRFVQRAVGTDDDGRLGPRTMLAINAANGPALVKSCHDQAVLFYRELHRQDPVKYPASMEERS